MHATRAQFAESPLRERYQEVRRKTVELTQPYSAEDQMLQSMPDCSPTKWHQAHTTWFFETFILIPHVAGYKPFDKRYKHLFNSYYKQLGSHPYRGARGLMSRPSLHEVQAYRAHVDEAMLRHLESENENTASLIELGLNHEQQHQELILTDIKHALWSMPLSPGRVNQPRAISPDVSLQWIYFEGGIHKIGHSGTGFAFDNESPQHEVLLRLFRLASRLTTNGEYLQFMDDGGYRRPELWLSDGWDTVCTQGWRSPLYWEEDAGRWFEFALSGMRELDPASPVCHVSYYEADAYARWVGARLPREEEWEIAAAQNPSNGTLLETGRLHPQPARGSGLQQIFGDVWEWTSSAYLAYPGFEPAAGLVGEYNGKFMCNQFVLRGGSCATPSSHIRATYRNFFPPHARWQFSGIRLAK
jgi:ergothioneine biosynthesis protein EgtB